MSCDPRPKRKTKDLNALSQRSFRRRVNEEISLAPVNNDVDDEIIEYNNDRLQNDNLNNISVINYNTRVYSSPPVLINNGSADNFSNDSEESADDSNIVDSDETSNNSSDKSGNNTSDDPSNNASADNSYSSSDILSDETVIFDNEAQFKDKLSFWAVLNKVKHNVVDDLLCILRKQPCGQNLPKSAKTLLSTPRNTIIRTVSQGYYVHFGIRAGLTEVFELEQKITRDLNINLKIATDGLPLSDSSTSELWPIMGSILHSSRVFIIGVYHGYTKPNDSNDFLQDFFTEIVDLINNGFLYKDEIRYNVSLYCIICDTPARSFITMTKGHAGYFSCSKCCQEGEYIENRMCFPNITNNVLRTDNGFINQEYNDHQLGRSILNDIPNFKPVSQIPLEYMHLSCIDVMKKIMTLWLSGKPASKIVRLPSNKIKLISSNLLAVRAYIPNDFARRPQRIEKLGLWKATELRQFLLYTAPVILHGILNP